MSPKTETVHLESASPASYIIFFPEGLARRHSECCRMRCGTLCILPLFSQYKNVINVDVPTDLVCGFGLATILL